MHGEKQISHFAAGTCVTTLHSVTNSKPGKSERPSRARARAPRIAVVVNGNAKGVTEDLVQILDQIVQTGDLFVSRTLEEGRDIARRVVAQGYPTVLTGGGDGTFSLMVTWVLEECASQDREPPRFGLLRLGTGNALAWVLGAQKPEGRGMFADLTRLRGAVGSNTLRLVDVDGRLAPFGGIGVDGMALNDFNQLKETFARLPLLSRYGTGAVAYALSIGGVTMPKLLRYPRMRFRIVNHGRPALRLDDDGQPMGQPVEAGGILFEGEARATIFSTIPYWGFGARVFPFAGEDPERFSLRIVDIGPLKVLANLSAIWRGTYRNERVFDWLVDDVVLEADAPLPLQVAGDAAGEHRRLRVRLLDEPIRVVDYYAPPAVD